MENLQGELACRRRLPADRVANQLQQVRFDMGGGLAVNEGYRGGDPAQPRQQHPGNPNHPPVALMHSPMDQLLDDSTSQVIGRRRVLE